MTSKKYKVGMYGGKFMPMHKGHLHCLEVASQMCEKVWLIMFVGGKQEEHILDSDYHYYLDVPERLTQVARAARMFDNVIPVAINISDCKFENGEEDWDAETPLVYYMVGHFDAVFGSEPSYADYFKRAYPWADYILVDPERKEVPISSTAVRNMGEEERKEWII